jgi:hypothetical protein
LWEKIQKRARDSADHESCEFRKQPQRQVCLHHHRRPECGQSVPQGRDWLRRTASEILDCDRFEGLIEYRAAPIEQLEFRKVSNGTAYDFSNFQSRRSQFLVVVHPEASDSARQTAVARANSCMLLRRRATPIVN